MYRDLITDDLNPTIGPERPAVDVRWQHDRATFTTGTTGKPRRIHAAALFTPKTDPARPTAHELVRLAAERPGGECRLTLVGADELCLLVHPIQVVDHEAVVVDAAGRPQLQMTRSLHETARSKPTLRAWLDRAVDTEPLSVVSNDQIHHWDGQCSACSKPATTSSSPVGTTLRDCSRPSNWS